MSSIVDRCPRSERTFSIQHVLLENSDRKQKPLQTLPPLQAETDTSIDVKRASLQLRRPAMSIKRIGLQVHRSLLEPISLALLEQIWRVNHQQNRHDRKHRHRVKDIQKHFVAVDMSPVPLDVLHDSHNVPHKDERACRVQALHMLLPR